MMLFRWSTKHCDIDLIRSDSCKAAFLCISVSFALKVDDSVRNQKYVFSAIIFHLLKTQWSFCQNIALEFGIVSGQTFSKSSWSGMLTSFTAILPKSWVDGISRLYQEVQVCAQTFRSWEVLPLTTGQCQSKFLDSHRNFPLLLRKSMWYDSARIHVERNVGPAH